MYLTFKIDNLFFFVKKEIFSLKLACNLIRIFLHLPLVFTQQMKYVS